MTDFNDKMQDILNKGVGSPGSSERRQVVDNMYDAFDSLTTNQKANLANGLLDDLESGVEDEETRLGLFVVVGYLMKDMFQ